MSYGIGFAISEGIQSVILESYDDREPVGGGACAAVAFPVFRAGSLHGTAKTRRRPTGENAFLRECRMAPGRFLRQQTW